MASFPLELVYGLYLGLLTGVIPALVSWVLGFVVRYLTGVTIPGFGVVVLGLAIAGVNGGLLALSDPTVIGSVGTGVPVIVGIVVIVMMSLYAHAKGDAMGASFPKRVSLRSIRERTLSADVVDLVGGRGEVTVRVTGDVGDIEGYPSLSPDLRASVRGAELTLPADLPLSELETRFADRLRADFDLSEVVVRIDERGRATASAAPPLSGVSKRVPEGKRAVSVETLVPTGVARGDEVTLLTPGERVTGTVVSVGEAAAGGDAPVPEATTEAVTDGGEEGDAPPAPARVVTATGGEGRLTVAVARPDARTLLGVETDPVVLVTARGTRREFELLSLLRRAGRRVRRLPVGEGVLDGVTLGSVGVREAYGVAVIAVRHGGTWRFVPHGDTSLEAGDEVLAVGTGGDLETFRGAIA
ncbi:TrkA C-terminal domain-containing protein [Halomarina litorea]|uniref:TrkA C-terminal domain-containing protein n=1 Tax=Halomarina litorea TaxID=2961595 RepID=UPI0020C25BBF|nr:TrkA C-terminal domain-containing protein [Halomarina sp. BCD28]